MVTSQQLLVNIHQLRVTSLQLVVTGFQLLFTNCQSLVTSSTYSTYKLSILVLAIIKYSEVLQKVNVLAREAKYHEIEKIQKVWPKSLSVCNFRKSFTCFNTTSVLQRVHPKFHLILINNGQETQHVNGFMLLFYYQGIKNVNIKMF